MVQAAARFCGAPDVAIVRLDGDVLRGAAAVGPFGRELASRSGGIEALEFPVSTGSVSGRAILTRRSVHVHDLAAEPEDELPVGRDLQRRFGHHTILATPLLREGTPLGAILLFRTEAQPFSERQLELVKIFADQAVIAIENVRLFQELQARNRDLTETLEQQTATGEILRVISSSPTDVQPVFDTIARSARALCDSDSAGVYTYDGEIIRLETLDNANPAQANALRQAYPMPATTGTATGRALLSGRPTHIADAREDPGYVTDALRDLVGLRTLLSVPMIRDGAAIGAITVQRWGAPRPFSDAQIALLETFADQAVIAIQNVRLFRELEVRNRDLTETLEQQTATGEILRVISSSPTDVQPVFDAVVKSAARLCESFDSAMCRRDGDRMLVVAHHGPIPMGPVGEFSFPLTRDNATGRAALDAATVHVADMQEETAEFSESSGNARRMGFRTILCVPLLRDGVALGTIQLRRTSKQPFTDRQVALLQTFADQAVIAIENVRLFRELEVRNRALTESLEQQTATGEILRVISSSPTDVQPVFDTIVRSVVRLCGGLFSALFRYDGELIHQVAQHNFTDEGLEEVRRIYPVRPTRDHGSGRAILERAVVHIPDVERDPEYRHRGLTRAVGMRSGLYVPMMREGEPIGVIMVARAQPGPFSEAQIGLLRTFADQAVIAIENVRLFTELEVRNRDLSLALDQQTATSEILRVISSSPTDIEPVFRAIVTSGRRLCEGEQCTLVGFDGEMVSLLAFDSNSAAGGERVSRIFPYRAHRGGTAGRAVLDRRVVHIPDVMADPEYGFKGLAETADYRAHLGVPMFRGDDVVGVLIVARTRPGPFSPAQIDLLKTFADQAVIAIQNVRLFKELEARNHDLTETLEQQTATGEILRVISSSPTDVQPVFDAVVTNAVRLCGALHSAAVRLDGDLLHLVAHHNWSPEGLATAHRLFPVPVTRDHVTAHAVREARTIHLNDIQDDPAVAASSRELAIAQGYQTLLVVPMLRDREAIGAIIVAKVEGPFSEGQVALLQTFADQAVIAIENVRLFKELEVRNAT